MKQNILAVLSLALLLVACGKDNNTGVEAPPVYYNELNPQQLEQRLIGYWVGMEKSGCLKDSRTGMNLRYEMRFYNRPARLGQNSYEMEEGLAEYHGSCILGRSSSSLPDRSYWRVVDGQIEHSRSLRLPLQRVKFEFLDENTMIFMHRKFIKMSPNPYER